MNLSPLETTDGRPPNGVGKAVSESLSLIKELSDQLRTISHSRHPPLLDEVGLRSALRLYLDGFSERSKIRVDFAFPDDLGRLPQDMETTIFRMVQECLTNVHRHSGSPQARVRVFQLDQQICVEVEDKGKGIPPEKRQGLNSGGKLGVGITGMQERLRQLGGTLAIHSSSKGTLVAAKLPVTSRSSRVVV